MIVRYTRFKNAVSIELFMFFVFVIAWPIADDPVFSVEIGCKELRLVIRIEGNTLK